MCWKQILVLISVKSFNIPENIIVIIPQSYSIYSIDAGRQGSFVQSTWPKSFAMDRQKWMGIPHGVICSKFMALVEKIYLVYREQGDGTQNHDDDAELDRATRKR